jgi:transposase
LNKKPGTSKDAADKLVKNIRRKTRQTYSAEEKIRIVLAGLRGEESISALCRREGISDSLYYTWSKEFLEAGKRRLSGDTARQATSPEVKDLWSRLWRGWGLDRAGPGCSCRQRVYGPDQIANDAQRKTTHKENCAACDP